MLVLLDGYVIDTTKIYKISNVKFDPSGYGSHSFKIFFYNKREMRVGRNAHQLLDPYPYTKEEQNKIIDINRKIVEAAHEAILSYWNKSNLEIPEIKL